MPNLNELYEHAHDLGATLALLPFEDIERIRLKDPELAAIFTDLQQLGEDLVAHLAYRVQVS